MTRTSEEQRNVRLKCGCSPYRSRGRTRCQMAIDLHVEFKRLQAIEWDHEAAFGPASPQRKRAMERRLVAWRDYTEHLKGNAGNDAGGADGRDGGSA